MKNVLCAFPGGRFKALTLSYDDNTPELNRRLVSIFKKHGIKATFFLNSGLFPEDTDWQEVRTLYEGFEIGSHTSTTKWHLST